MKRLLLIVLMSMSLGGCAFHNQLHTDRVSDAPDGDSDAASDASDGDSDAASDLVTAPDNWNPTAALTPTAIHMTYQRDPDTAITLQWQTASKDAAYVPRVWLAKAARVPGADPAQFEQDVSMPFDATLTAAGKGTAYCQDLICDPDQFTGLEWEAEITGLEPDTTYYYRVGTWADYDVASRRFTGAELSPVYHFRTGLPKGSTQAFRFGFGSDSQNWMDTITDASKAIRAGNGKDARFWLFGGDLTEDGTQDELWGWFDVLQPMLHYIPFMPVQGNHDIYNDAFFGEFAWPVMNGLPSAYVENAWSFNHGNAHFIGFNSKSQYVVAKELGWLESDLKAASTDPGIDWIIVIFHHPAYSSSSVHGSTDYIDSLVVPLFDTYGVDLTFSGHDHDYERTKPLKGGEIMDAGKGTVYVVSGGFYSKKSYGNGTSDFTAISVDGETKSYVVVDIQGKTLNGTAYDGKHQLLDRFTLTK